MPEMTPPSPVVPPSPSPAGTAPVPAAAAPALLSIQEFKRMELAVGEVKSAVIHPKADKLMLVQVDLGAAGVRQVVAGIRSCYTVEQLVGRQVIVVVNLAPAVLRGEKSEGMILAAEGLSGTPVLLAPDSKVAIGAKVR